MNNPTNDPHNTPSTRQYPPILSETLSDLSISGIMMEIDPEEADTLGTFEETALTEEDAWEANSDLISGDNTHG